MIEGANVILNSYLQGGAVVVIIIMFAVLLVWVVKSSEKRENRLYNIIDVLSEKLEVLPHIREELEQIKEQLRGRK
ncbi:MAG: BhlA/UviB family holin-like peptide [Bacilli bacterium]